MKARPKPGDPGQPPIDPGELCHCGKQGYRTKAGAKKQAKAVQTRRGGGLMDTYRCRVGGRWHFGHSSRGRKAVTPERRRRR